MNINIGLKGKYQLVVRGPSGTRKRDVPNLITDQGLFWLNRLGRGSGQPGAGQPFDAYCHLGTGSTAPSAADTTLEARVASVAVAPGGRSVWRDPDSNYEVHEYRTSYTFAQGAVTGVIAEVGVGPNANGTGICSRALVVDGAGSPDPITVTSADTVTVEYAVETYVDSTEVQTGTIGGSPYQAVPRGTPEGIIPGSIGGPFHLLQFGFMPASLPEGYANYYPKGLFIAHRGMTGAPASRAWPYAGSIAQSGGGSGVDDSGIPESCRTITFPTATSQKHTWVIEQQHMEYPNEPITNIWVPLVGAPERSTGTSGWRQATEWELTSRVLLAYRIDFDEPRIPNLVDKRLTLEFTISWSNA